MVLRVLLLHTCIHSASNTRSTVSVLIIQLAAALHACNVMHWYTLVLEHTIWLSFICVPVSSPERQGGFYIVHFPNICLTVVCSVKRI